MSTEELADEVCMHAPDVFPVDEKIGNLFHCSLLKPEAGMAFRRCTPAPAAPGSAWLPPRGRSGQYNRGENQEARLALPARQPKNREFLFDKPSFVTLSFSASYCRIPLVSGGQEHAYREKKCFLESEM